MDNPCWGSSETTQHDLSYLLSLIESGAFCTTATTTKQESMIIHQVGNYLVLNKPPDLRMDGPHLATVHKLLTYWYPPPSLLQQLQQEQEQEEKQNEHQHQLQLHNAISKLSKFNDLKDNYFRPAHQLDYATSGVLLIAKSKKAAAIACGSFEARSVQKEYIAIVRGHIFPNDDCTVTSTTHTSSKNSSNMDDIPMLTVNDPLWKEWSDGTFEIKHRKHCAKINNKRKQNTFSGYMPVHAIFLKWKGAMTNAKKYNKKKKRQQQQHERNDEIQDSNSTSSFVKGEKNTEGHYQRQEEVLEEELNTLDKILHMKSMTPNKNNNSTAINGDFSFTNEKKELLLNSHWKQVKNDPLVKAFFGQMTDKYNQYLQATSDQTTTSSDASSSNTVNDKCKRPRIEETQNQQVQTKSELPTIFIVEGEVDSFYIHAPLAEVPDEFRVVTKTRFTDTDVDDDDNNNKTHSSNVKKKRIASILQYDDSIASKLDFKPSLTRCIVLERGTWRGKPISKVLLQPKTGRRHQLRVHMALCGHPILGDATYESEKDKDSYSQNHRITYDRMCLHAHKLSITLMEGKATAFTAPDPFVWRDENILDDGKWQEGIE